MTSTITYKGELRTEAIHTKSETVLHTDAPIDNEGLGRSFSPTDLVATALGSCILTIMGIAARKHDIDIDGARVTVEKTMQSNPRRISRLDIDINMGEKNYSPKEQKVLERAAYHCPVAESLHADLETEIHIHWASNT